MRNWTEDEIREALDGKFFRLTYEGRTVVESVPPEFTPSLKPPTAHAGAKRGNYTHWTDNDDAILIGLKIRGHTLADIGKVLDRTPDSVKSRFQYLQEKGRA